MVNCFQYGYISCYHNICYVIKNSICNVIHAVNDRSASSEFHHTEVSKQLFLSLTKRDDGNTPRSLTDNLVRLLAVSEREDSRTNCPHPTTQCIPHLPLTITTEHQCHRRSNRYVTHPSLFHQSFTTRLK